ncbi:ABC transporter permease [Cereibacter changlensis JA139]|uniref:ABC transporter permease n=2 Tax=Cereibacter changlensis TaxID=402884 RepID=A0A2T4JQW7_9RHOB|nr:ABC transporter permease [Cereibacter changlensis]PTE20278.1 ABC transporter permease [Cereibacter changlensis JA139]PZX57101.1 NitT/TauT family transport system permease protein [Cereibacter changlensis]
MTDATQHIDAGEGDTVWVEEVSLIDSMPRWLAMGLLFVVAVGIWDLVTRMGWVSPIILPSPGETLADLIFVGRNLFTGGYMLEALWTTTQTVFWAFLIALGIGFLLGVLVGETKFGERAVLPYLVAIDTMPKVAFAPLFIAWLGFGISSKVALAAFIATFPIVVSTAAGLYAASESERMLFKAMGATRMQTLLRLKLPIGLPYMFTGLKIAAVGVMAGAITGEFLGGGKGFGALIRQSASQMDTPRVFALILYLSLLGLLLYFTVVWAQRRIVFWNKEERAGGLG